MEKDTLAGRTEDTRKEARQDTAQYFSRRRRRRQDFFEIRKRDSQQLLGHMIDLSGHGLRVVGDHPFESGVKYQLLLVLPYKVDGVETIEFDVWCRWAMQNAEEALFYAGMEIAEISDEQRGHLEKLLASW